MTDLCFPRRLRRPTSTSRNNTDPRGHTRSTCGHSLIVHGGITEAIERRIKPAGPERIEMAEEESRRAQHMTQSNKRNTQPSQDVALIVGGGPGISASCAKLFAERGMQVGIAAR